ncbi:MAG: Ig-like domain-containing protein [Bacilli bacterium]|nr:Ig-like domain-containing protein [Bacilli bacterium]
MKAKKAILPILASALVLSMGLVACNKPAQSNNPGGNTTSEVEEAKIVITSAGDKKEIQVGETLQLTASVEGVAWSTKSTDIVSVSETGLVTALKDGSARITAKKDGYTNGTFTVTVLKAPEKEAKYSLPLEDAEHYSPNDFWGMDLSAYGYGIIGPGDSPVENNSGATEDSTSLGYLQAGCKETLKFRSDKAANVEMGITMAYATEMQLEGAITVKFNGKDISLAGKSTVVPETENNYYEFHAISLGQVDLIAGENVLEIEIVTQGPNMDSVVFFTNETLQLATIPAAVKPKIEVVNADVEVEVGQEVQIQVKDNLAGVTFTSADETVATVSATGLVKGVKSGKTTVELTKDGYKKATVNVVVKAVGQVILEAENAVIPEGSSIQIESQASASGGKSLGYFGAGMTFSIAYTSDAAKTMDLSLVAAACDMDQETYAIKDMNLAESMSLTLNGNAVSLQGKTLPGNSSWNFANWQEVDLGSVQLKQGENTFVFTAVTQGPNIDCIKLTDPNATPVTPVEEKVTVSFDANGGTGTMADVQAAKGEYELPACTFTGPGTKVFAGWEVMVTVTYGQWSFEQAQVKQPGEKIDLSKDITIKATWKVNIVKSAQVDLTNAFVMEAEEATIAGAQTQQGGSPVEDNESSHGGKDVGYMAAGASITFNFNASAAGQVKLVLMGRSASANWMTQPVQYYDHALEETTSIKVNNADVDVTSKGFLGSDGKTSVQVDLGNVSVQSGANTIVISAIAQAPNIDCIALVANGITFTLPQA